MFNDFLLTKVDNSNQYLITSVENSLYAFELSHILEIIPFTKIELLSSTTNSVVGLVNLHGEHVPAYDFRLHLGHKPKPYSLSQQMVVLSVEEKKIILIVDYTGDIVQIPDDKISSLSSDIVLNFIYASSIFNEKNIMFVDIVKFLENANSANIECNINELMPLDSQVLTKLDDRANAVKINIGQVIEQSLFLNDKFVIFTLNGEYYCFGINYVKYINKITLNEITKIPLVPNYIHGIINFRGDYISIIDIKHFLNLKETPIKDKNEIIVLKVDNLKIAVFVDKIVDITSLPIDMLNLNDAFEDSFIIGELNYMNNKVLNMLNIEKLFSEENMSIELR